MPYFRQTFIVTAQASYPTTPQVDLSNLFEPTGYSIGIVGNGAGDTTIAYSLDGVNDHGVCVEGKPSAAQSFGDRSRRVWLRKVSGTGVLTAEVQAKN